MRQSVLCVALLLVITLANAQALPACPLQCYQGLPEAPLHVGSSGHVLDLTEPTQYCACNVEIEPQAKIVTHGFPLTIYAENRLKIGAGASIAAFATPTAASGKAGGNGGNGGNGGGYETGPHTEGNCEGCDGMNGSPGGDGQPGENGIPGGNAGAVRVLIGAQLEGVLNLDNSGQAGGNGGRGGDGGNGGDGQQGGRGKDGVFDCESGPGRGGQGGVGGNSGRGGIGGTGGQGASVEVVLPTQHDVDQFKALATNVRLTGGRGGLDGPHGGPGTGGHGGYGGRGNHHCQGEVDSRRTADASAGKSSAQMGYPNPARKPNGGDGQLIIGVFKPTPENPAK